MFAKNMLLNLDNMFLANIFCYFGVISFKACVIFIKKVVGLY